MSGQYPSPVPSETKRTGSDPVVDALLKAGFDTRTLLPSIQLEYLFGAVHSRHGKLRVIYVHFEKGVA